jgi:deazaflavin-dependent oxidoreductase (nitroreductase family)
MASFELPEWMADHLRRYLETDGKDGHMWRGVPTLLLTTIGRRSGDPRTLPLIYGEQDGAYTIIGSKGGSPTHPRWYLNLVAEPKVRVQVEADKFAARARTATGAERESLWKKMEAIFPPYADYQRRTEREIPVIVLEREG